MHQPPSALQVHLWEDSIPNLSQTASFPLFPNSSSDTDISQRGKEAASDCWIRAYMCQQTPSAMFCVSLETLTSNTDPSHLSHLHLTLHTAKWPRKIDRLCFKNGSPAVFAVAMLTSHVNAGFKHFFKLSLFVLFLLLVHWKKTNCSKHPSELLTL